VYLAARLAEALESPLFALGKLESSLLRETLDNTPIVKPVFVTGLARAGTTTLLEMLSTQPGVATHRYRDFPFLAIPYIWNRVLTMLPKPTTEAKERPHGDGIIITPESPEAMEEMLWMHFFPHAHDPQMSSVLDASTRNAAFEACYRDHLRKLLLVRGATRYVSKGNYNITRIAYLHQLFPDAKFIIPVRSPAAHIVSLMRQHANFNAAAKEDARVKHFLRIAGHFEFGPDTRFINTGRSTPPAITAMTDVRVWAKYWNEVYAHVHETLERNPVLSASTRVVRYEDFCADPVDMVRRILDFTGFDSAGQAEVWAAKIHAPNYYSSPLSTEELDIIAQETLEARLHFGYA
jgi:hypothetical protein